MHLQFVQYHALIWNTLQAHALDMKPCAALVTLNHVIISFRHPAFTKKFNLTTRKEHVPLNTSAVLGFNDRDRQHFFLP